MRESEAIEKVRLPFDYLFDDYGYKVIGCRLFANSGNWIVVLESPSCGRFLVFQDRGEIIVAMGPHGSPVSATDGSWFDLGVIVEHLSDGRHVLGRLSGDPEHQLAEWAAVLRPYMDRVCPLFTEADFLLAEANLNAIGQRREDEIWGPE